MLTLAHLLRRNAGWRDHTLRVLRIVETEEARAAAVIGLQRMIAESRFDAHAEAVVATGKPFDVIAQHSGNSAACFVGLAVEALADRNDPLGDYDDLVTRMRGNVLITKSWQALDL